MHRLVAMMFIDNPDNLAYVNHKNGDKFDNRVDNLEWISPSDNKKHATKTLRAAGPKVGVDQYSLDGTKLLRIMIQLLLHILILCKQESCTRAEENIIRPEDLHGAILILLEY